jgi:tetratricopeptide (TPR) repeat protein
VSEGEDPKPPWQHLIGQLEIARERGQTTYALEGLRAVRAQAAEQGDLEAVGLATAHIVVCLKHLYQNTGTHSHLLTMEKELKQALALPVSDWFKAVFLMRYADVECERGNFQQAEFCCREAHSLTSKNSHAEAECLGRWAYAKTLLGELSEAEDLFALATKIIAEHKDPRTFQRVTLESGLLARRIKLCLARKRYASAAKCFLRGYSLAWEYRLIYGMPQRVRQYHQGLCRAVGSTLRLNLK